MLLITFPIILFPISNAETEIIYYSLLLGERLSAIWQKLKHSKKQSVDIATVSFRLPQIKYCSRERSTAMVLLQIANAVFLFLSINYSCNDSVFTYSPKQ
jgi:hypothetical protein